MSGPFHHDHLQILQKDHRLPQQGLPDTPHNERNYLNAQLSEYKLQYSVSGDKTTNLSPCRVLLAVTLFFRTF